MTAPDALPGVEALSAGHAIDHTVCRADRAAHRALPPRPRAAPPAPADPAVRLRARQRRPRGRRDQARGARPRRRAAAATRSGTSTSTGATRSSARSPTSSSSCSGTSALGCPPRRGGEAVECGGLKTVGPGDRSRGFESLPLRLTALRPPPARPLPRVRRPGDRVQRELAHVLRRHADGVVPGGVRLLRRAGGESGSDVVLAETTCASAGRRASTTSSRSRSGSSGFGTTSMVALFTARRGEETLVEGRTVYVFVDPATMAKQPIPDRRPRAARAVRHQGNGAG